MMPYSRAERRRAAEAKRAAAIEEKMRRRALRDAKKAKKEEGKKAKEEARRRKQLEKADKNAQKAIDKAIRQQQRNAANDRKQREKKMRDWMKRRITKVRNGDESLERGGTGTVHDIGNEAPFEEMAWDPVTNKQWQQNLFKYAERFNVKCSVLRSILTGSFMTGRVSFEKGGKELTFVSYDDGSICAQLMDKPVYFIREATPDFIRISIVHGLLCELIRRSDQSNEVIPLPIPPPSQVAVDNPFLPPPPVPPVLARSPVYTPTTPSPEHLQSIHSAAPFQQVLSADYSPRYIPTSPVSADYSPCYIPSSPDYSAYAPIINSAHQSNIQQGSSTDHFAGQYVPVSPVYTAL